MRIRYLRSNNPTENTPFGAVVQTDDDHIGWSLCCPHDQFRKELARRIAEGRAKTNADAFATVCDLKARIAWAHRFDTWRKAPADTSRLEAVLAAAEYSRSKEAEE